MKIIMKIIMRIKDGFLNLSKIYSMCVKVICQKCKKYTWSGCGKHVEEALKGVAEADKCKCKR